MTEIKIWEVSFIQTHYCMDDWPRQRKGTNILDCKLVTPKRRSFTPHQGSANHGLRNLSYACVCKFPEHDFYIFKGLFKKKEIF